MVSFDSLNWQLLLLLILRTGVQLLLLFTSTIKYESSKFGAYFCRT